MDDLPDLFVDKSKKAKTKLEYEVYRHVLSPKRMPFSDANRKDQLKNEKQKFIEIMKNKRRTDA